MVLEEVQVPAEVEDLNDLLPEDETGTHEMVGEVGLSRDDFLAKDSTNYFQVVNPDGKAYTFSSSCADCRFEPGELVVFVRFDDGTLRTRNGRSERNFAYMGVFKPGTDQPEIRLTNGRSECVKSDMVYRVAQWAILVVWLNEEIPPDYAILPASPEPDKQTDEKHEPTQHATSFRR